MSSLSLSITQTHAEETPLASWRQSDRLKGNLGGMICNRRSKVKRQLTVIAALPDAPLSFYFSTKSILSKMLSTRIQCALALLSLALAVSSVSAAPSDAKLRQLLQRSLLNPAGKQVNYLNYLAIFINDFRFSLNVHIISDMAANKQKHCPWCWNWRKHLHLESSKVLQFIKNI